MHPEMHIIQAYNISWMSRYTLPDMGKSGEGRGWAEGRSALGITKNLEWFKMNLKRILALVLSMLMLAATCVGAFAEAGQTQAASEPSSVELQGVNLSEASASQLSAEEAENYAEIAETLKGGEESVVVGSTTYTLDSASEDGTTVLTGVTVSEDSSVGVASVEQVVLTENVVTPSEGTVTPSEPGKDDKVLPDLVVDEAGEIEDVYEEKFVSTDKQVLTMMELYAGLGGNIIDPEQLAAYKQTEEYAFYNAFAESAGLGSEEGTRLDLLSQIAAEYEANKKAYEDYLTAYEKYQEELKTNPNAVAPTVVEEPVVPRYTLNGLEISMDKTVTDAVVGGVDGYKAEINIEANASYTVEYDGSVTVEVEVPTDKGTDFVITLDLSTSMDSSGKDDAMLQALKVVLGEIMANPKNTVSIVFYGYGAKEMTLDLNGDGALESVFKAADGYTADDIFNAKLAGTGISLAEACTKYSPLRAIRSAVGLSGGSTNTAQGLEAAYDVLTEVYGSTDATADNRNTGVLLFTDGAVNGDTEEEVIIAERKLAEEFGATIVNVSLGRSTYYEDYMNPENQDYKYTEDNRNSTIKQDYTAEREQMLKDKVVYYNIPDISNVQLANELTALFEMAFKTITTEKHQLQSGVITDGILAAVESTLIDTIPASLQIVEIPGKTPTYRFLGKDENGNTLIAWDIGNLKSGDKFTFSYFMVPVDENTELKVDIATGVDTVLITNPMDKMLDDSETEKEIAIIHRWNAETDSEATLPKTGVQMIPSAALWLGLAASAFGAFVSRRKED